MFKIFKPFISFCKISTLCFVVLFFFLILDWVAGLDRAGEGEREGELGSLLSQEPLRRLPNSRCSGIALSVNE